MSGAPQSTGRFVVFFSSRHGASETPKGEPYEAMKPHGACAAATLYSNGGQRGPQKSRPASVASPEAGARSRLAAATRLVAPTPEKNRTYFVFPSS
eukprot:scaffold4898_cov129-Isochrysis_galbana.AAC.2